MPKKIELKTGKSTASVSQFIADIKAQQKRKHAQTLFDLFKEVTGKPPVMWGTSMIGFGEYTYHRSNGDTGTYFATGFSPRENNLTIYIIPGYQEYGPLLAKLGPHTIGMSCLYLKSLNGVNLDVLKKLIAAGLKDLKKTHQLI